MKLNRFHYSSVGSGPPLVFVNGLFQYRGNWSPITKQLADHFTCICFDFPNQNTERNGEQADPNFDRPEQYEEYLLQFLAELSLEPEETMLCGLSWGASLLRNVHLRRGIQFKKLVLIGLHSPELGEFYRLFHQEFHALLTNSDKRHFLSTMQLWFFSQEWYAANAPVHEIMTERFVEMFSQEESLLAIHRSAIADFDRDFPEGRFLCPTTLLSGEYDHIAPPKYVERYARQAGAGFEQVPGGHIFSGEDPKLGAAVIKRALSEPAFCTI